MANLTFKFVCFIVACSVYNAAFCRDYIFYKPNWVQNTYIIQKSECNKSGQIVDSKIYVFKTLRAVPAGTGLTIQMGDTLLYQTKWKISATGDAVVEFQNVSHFGGFGIDLLDMDRIVYGGKFIRPIDFLQYTNHLEPITTNKDPIIIYPP